MVAERVIVGGGDVAARKAESDCSCRLSDPIIIVKPVTGIGERLRALPIESGSSLEERAVRNARRLRMLAFVIAATDDAEVNARVVADAHAANVLSSR